MNAHNHFEEGPLASFQDPPITDSGDASERNVRKISRNIEKILGYDAAKATREEAIANDSFTGSGLLHLHSTQEGGINMAGELTRQADALELALQDYRKEDEIPKYLKYATEARRAAHQILEVSNEVIQKERSMQSFNGLGKKRRHA